MRPYEKILIIGQPFNNNSGGGITQSNLFKAWDKDRIAVVCTSHMFNNLNADICNTYYLLGSEEYKWSFPFNLLQRKVLSGELKIKPSAENKEDAKFVATPLRNKLINNILYPLLEYIGVLHSISKITLSAKLCNWIDDYKPDAIYAQASTRETVLFCSLIQAYTKKPFIFHMMDDWPSTISVKGPFKKFWHKKIDKEFRLLLDKATVLLSISDGMAQEYKNRYKKEFITFHNPIEIQFWKSYQRKDYALSSPTTILYAGRIGTGIQDTLKIMAETIENLNKANGYKVNFVLQTSEKPSWVDKYNYTLHKPLVAYNELPKVFAQADILYLPYDFSEESIRFIKYSMPTKAPEYMVCGTPILMFAPEETALVIAAKKGKWAKLVTENNNKKLSEAVDQLLINEVERTQIALNAIKIAETEFNAEAVRNKFRNLIATIIKN